MSGGRGVDIIVHELTVHAAERLQEMVDAFRSDESEHVRRLLLMAVAEARLPAAISFLEEVRGIGGPRFRRLR